MQTSKITVAYTVRFSGFERNLARLGMRFTDQIAVIGVDPEGALTGTVLKEFAEQVIFVPAGSTTFSFPVNRMFSMTRTQLDEDPSFVGGPDFNPDEIRCRIRIRSAGLPPQSRPMNSPTRRYLKVFRRRVLMPQPNSPLETKRGQERRTSRSRTTTHRAGAG